MFESTEKPVDNIDLHKRVEKEDKQKTRCITQNSGSQHF